MGLAALGGRRRPRQGLPVRAVLRRRRALLARVSSGRERARRHRPILSRRPDRPLARRGECPQPRPRVRRRRDVPGAGSLAGCGRLRRAGRATGVVLRRTGRTGHTGALERASTGRGGAPPRRSQRVARRRLGPGGPGSPPRRRRQPDPERRCALDEGCVAERDHAVRWTRLLRVPPCPSGRRPLGRGRLGPPRHAVGRLDHRRVAARPPCRCRTRCACARGGRRAVAGGGRPRGVRRPAGLGPRRFVAFRLGPARLVAALRPPGASRRAGAGDAALRCRGRVPRARLGPRSDDDGRARRWHRGRPHDGVRARRARPAGPGRAGGRPSRTPAAAVRVDRRGLRAR